MEIFLKKIKIDFLQNNFVFRSSEDIKYSSRLLKRNEATEMFNIHLLNFLDGGGGARGMLFLVGS